MAPTTGLVSRDGIIPLSSRQDTVGPFARTVKCAARLLTAISGKSAYDDATDCIPFDSIPNYAEVCKGSRLDGLRLGVPRDALKGVDNVVMDGFERALEMLRSSGAVIVDNIKFTGADEWNEWAASSKRACLQAEFKHSIERWFEELIENPNDIRSLADLIRFTKTEAKECYPSRDIQRWNGSKKVRDTIPMNTSSHWR